MGANGYCDYSDSSGNLLRDETGNIIANYIGTLKDNRIDYSVYILYTKANNPILGFMSNINPQNVDRGGRAFADSKYILFPNDVSYKYYDRISDVLGIKMSRPGNLKTILNDEYQEVKSSDVKKGDLIIQYFMNGTVQETVYIGQIVNVKNRLIKKNVYFEYNGKIIKLNSKGFAGELKFYEKRNF